MSTPTPPANVPSPEVLAHARVDAGRMRAQWLLALSGGRATLHQLLVAATREDGKPLRALRLRQVLASQPGWSMAKSDAVLREMRMLAAVEPVAPNSSLNLYWLLDNRAAPGRRVTWLAGAILKQQLPYASAVGVSGFPYGDLGTTYRSAP